MRLRYATASTLLSLALASSALAQTVTVASVSGQCGKSVNVPVTISSTSGLLSFQFNVGYDSSKVTPTSVTKGSFVTDFSVTSNITSSEVRVAGASGVPVDGSGTLVTIAFNVAGSASGTASLPISAILINDVSKSGTNGKITISCVQPPSTPTNSSPANGATNVAPPVKLMWGAVTGATEYKVYFGNSSPPAYEGTTSSTSMTVSTASGTKYYWNVRAVNSAGQSSASTTWNFTTAGTFCATPAAPVITAPSSAASGSSYDVSWTTVANATEYVLEEAADAAFTAPTATTTTATKLSFTKTAASPTYFYYRVRARNLASGCSVNGAWSSAAPVQITQRPPIPPGSAVLVVVGSTPGSGGAMFRTSVQLYNPTAVTIHGRFVYHAAGASGTDGDLSMPFTIEPGQTVSYLDLLPSMGVPSGAGSIDIVPDTGSTMPVIMVRIYNDAGAGGTAGTTVDISSLDYALFAGQTGVLIGPIDAARARMNIGVRTLADGAAFTVTMRDKNGNVLLSRPFSYPATFLVQTLADIWLGVPMVSDASLTFTMESGSAIIYGSTPDNTTQDPNIQYARPLP